MNIGNEELQDEMRGILKAFYGVVDSIKENPVSVIYQSGYLTIKGYNKEFDEYRLGFPNAEVENGFVNLLSQYTNQK